MPPPHHSNVSRRPVVGGNWKMHLRRAEAVALAQAVAKDAPARNETLIFPPFVYLDAVSHALRAAPFTVALGAQDVSPEPDGAFTGEISLGMLQDLGVTACLVGHSERRHVIGETQDLIRHKTHAVVAAGLTCVLCVGETLEQREAGRTNEINESQLRSALHGVDAATTDRLIIAYEPVWAIGTGRNATPEDAQAAHSHIRGILASVFDAASASRIRIQYGGSVKPANAGALFAQPDVDGGLIGGASLKAADFLAICQAAAARA